MAVPPKAGKANPKHAVCRVDTKLGAPRSFQDCELVTESKNLDLQRSPNPEPGSEAGKQGKKDRGKHRAARLTRALDEINDFRSGQIFGMRSFCQTVSLELASVLREKLLQTLRGVNQFG